MKNKVALCFLVLAQIIGGCSDADDKSSVQKKKLEENESKNKQTKETAKSTEIKEVTHSDGTFELIHPGMNFRIIFPVSNVEKFTSKDKIMDQNVEIFNYSANMKDKIDDNLVYHLSFTSMPHVKSNEEIKLLFENYRDHILKVSKSKLVFDKDFQKFGASGKHFNYVQTGSFITTNFQVFFKNGIFYQVIVATDSANKSNKFIKTFMDSFEILE